MSLTERELISEGTELWWSCDIILEVSILENLTSTGGIAMNEKIKERPTGRKGQKGWKEREEKRDKE